MEKQLSIIDGDKHIDLNTNWADRVPLSKGFLDGLPFGAALSDIMFNYIPNQKIERIKLFIEVLDQKLRYISEDVADIKSKLNTENGIELLEEAFRQASQAKSEERRKYIASLFVNGLSREDLNQVEKNQLFSLMDQINEVEILVLKYESLRTHFQKQFFETHKDSLDYPSSHIGAEQKIADVEAININYRKHLVQLDLLNQRFVTPKKGDPPVFDENTGRLKTNGYKATSLGRLLLRYIHLNDENAESD